MSLRCPNCYSYDIDCNDSVDVDSESAVTSFECATCKCDFRVVFKPARTIHEDPLFKTVVKEVEDEPEGNEGR